MIVQFFPSFVVIPAKAGIQLCVERLSKSGNGLGPDFRRVDGNS